MSALNGLSELNPDLMFVGCNNSCNPIHAFKSDGFKKLPDLVVRIDVIKSHEDVIRDEILNEISEKISFC